MTHHRVVVIGGGNAGLSVAGRLRRHGVHDVVVIEPREQHLFQPLPLSLDSPTQFVGEGGS